MTKVSTDPMQSQPPFPGSRTEVRCIFRTAGSILALVLVPGTAAAELDLQAHVEVGPARMVGAPKADQFAWGAVGLLVPELRFNPRFGVECPLGFVALAPGPGDPANGVPIPSSVGTAFLVTPGLRVQPMMESGATVTQALWLAGGAGLAVTGPHPRPAIEVRAGWDLHLQPWAVGPMMGFLQIIETTQSEVPGDARVLWFGAHGAFDVPLPRSAPPAPDQDHDGIPDTTDKCPDQPETKNDIEDDDGCPELDTDGDGVLDSLDKCPTRAEDKDRFQDDDGCPDDDNDSDGILDGVDRCQNEPETRNGYQDQDGCPDEAPPKTPGIPQPRLVNVQITLGQPLMFEFDKVELDARGLADVAKLAKVLNEHPELVLVRVIGHADEVGDDLYNLKLSERRAQGIKAALVRAGVEEKRLTAIAMGKAQPVQSGMLVERRQRNRRVELEVVQRREAAPATEPVKQPPQQPQGARRGAQ